MSWPTRSRSSSSRRAAVARCSTATRCGADRLRLDRAHRRAGARRDAPAARMLRDDDEEKSRAPQPSLERLEALVDEMRASGLPVELDVEGVPNGIPPGIDVSGYRIVQEALTNVLKHAGPAVARVAVRYTPDAVEIAVVDDGRGGLTGPGRATAARDQGAGRGRRRRDRGGAAARRRVRRPRSAAVPGRRVIRVLLADDQALVRTGFRLILSGEPGHRGRRRGGRRRRGGEARGRAPAGRRADGRPHAGASTGSRRRAGSSSTRRARASSC